MIFLPTLRLKILIKGIMEQPLPMWLCDNFLEHCLFGSSFGEGNQNVVVSNFTVSTATPPGNNFASNVIRVHLEYTGKGTDDTTSGVHSLSLVLKEQRFNGFVNELFEISFSENIFYNTFLPEASKFADVSFAPKSLFSPKFSTIVLEDLKQQGFVLADRTHLLDFEHCRLYIEAATSLHAVSFVVHKENSELVKSIGKEKIFSDELNSAESCQILLNHGLECFIEATEKIEKFSKYAKTIRSIRKKLWNMLVEAHKPSEGLNTITHGQPYTSNMMFKYDDQGEVKDMKLVDFKHLRYGSPVNDFVFFIWTSADYEVRKTRIWELYHLYVDTFNKKLEQFNCDEKLTYIDFTKALKKLSPLKLVLAAAMTPLIYCSDPLDFNVLFEKANEGKENPYKSYYSEEFCQNHLPVLLEQLASIGVFDYLKKECKKKKKVNFKG